MNISIVSPCYNEEESIERFFDAINKVEYKDGKRDVTIIDDSSIDNSWEILHSMKKKYPSISLHFFQNKTNKGRAEARVHAAQKAAYENLLFVDMKCQLWPNALNVVKEKKENVVVGNALQKIDQDNWFAITLNVIRSRLYPESFGDRFDDIQITQNNFDMISKGTTIFFVKKDIFLATNKLLKLDKYSSDDTKLLKQITSLEGSILKTSDLKVRYNTRKGVMANIKHLFARGPKFVDYYINSLGKKIFFLSLVLCCLLFLFFFKSYWIYFLGCYMLVCFFLTQDYKLLYKIAITLPAIFLSFILGVFYGMYINIGK